MLALGKVMISAKSKKLQKITLRTRLLLTCGEGPGGASGDEKILMVWLACLPVPAPIAVLWGGRPLSRGRI
jgi:hypothetical protein